GGGAASRGCRRHRGAAGGHSPAPTPGRRRSAAPWWARRGRWRRRARGVEEHPAGKVGGRAGSGGQAPCVAGWHVPEERPGPMGPRGLRLPPPVRRLRHAGARLVPRRPRRGRAPADRVGGLQGGAPARQGVLPRVLRGAQAGQLQVLRRPAGEPLVRQLPHRQLQHRRRPARRRPRALPHGDRQGLHRRRPGHAGHGEQVRVRGQAGRPDPLGAPHRHRHRVLDAHPGPDPARLRGGEDGRRQQREAVRGQGGLPWRAGARVGALLSGHRELRGRAGDAAPVLRREPPPRRAHAAVQVPVAPRVRELHARHVQGQRQDRGERGGAAVRDVPLHQRVRGEGRGGSCDGDHRRLLRAQRRHLHPRQPPSPQSPGIHRRGCPHRCQGGAVQDTAGRQPVRRAGGGAGPGGARARHGHVQHQPRAPWQGVPLRLRLRRAPAVQLPQHAHQDRPGGEDGQELVRGGRRAVRALLRGAPRRPGGRRRRGDIHGERQGRVGLRTGAGRQDLQGDCPGQVPLRAALRLALLLGAQGQVTHTRVPTGAIVSLLASRIQDQRIQVGGR
uniref:Uncharacterized protein n=1 Tax=Aegilops tauschii subsp. strangulata TaxID=200361 RepID=A0A453FEH0_AEGTS